MMRLVWSLVCGAMFVLGLVFFFSATCAWGAMPKMVLVPPSVHQAEARPEPSCEWLSETEMLRNSDMTLSMIAPVGLERILAQMRAEGKDFGRVDRAWLGTALDTATVFLVVDDCLIAVATAPVSEVEAIIQGRDPPPDVAGH